MKNKIKNNIAECPIISVNCKNIWLARSHNVHFRLLISLVWFPFHFDGQIFLTF